MIAPAVGSVGSTGSITGACASFLYNLQKGIEQISAVVVEPVEAVVDRLVDGIG